MTKIFLIIIFVVVGYFAIKNLQSRGYFDTTLSVLPSAGESVVLATPNPYVGNGKAPKEVQYKVVPFVAGLKIPWSIVFTSKTRMLVTEREGAIRLVENGKLNPKPLITFGETSHSGEEGLLGMVLDPNYDANKLLYVVVAYGKDSNTVEKVIRLRDVGDSIVEDKNILDDIPTAKFHDGGTLRFGPDGKLYVSTGDALSKQNAQKLDSLSGKILRINSDGSIPSDNPFPNSPVYSYGHRNPQGFDWYPSSHVMYETEHGPSTYDGPPGGDEVNVIEPGSNYGWPVVDHERHTDNMVDPKILFTPAFAPASGMFYTGRVFPQFYGNFFFGGLVGEGIMRVVVEPSNPSKVLSYGKLSGVSVGRVRNIAEGPDGFIYFSTSNRDGRGKPRDGDDQIYRLVPQ